MTAPTRRAVLQLAAGSAAALALPAPAHAQPELGAAQAQRDLRVLQRAFTALHPGLHRYASAEALNTAFASATQAVAEGCSRAQLLLQVMALAAQVRCGHTHANPGNQRGELRAALFEGPHALPLALRWHGTRALVRAAAAPGIAPGSELLAVDDRPMAELAQAMLPLLRADGASDNKRLAQLDTGSNGDAFERLLPLLHPARAAQRRLRLRGPGGGPEREVAVAPVTPAARRAALPEPSEDWTLQREGDTAVLTLPTFAFWNSRFDGRAFLAQAFESLQAVPQLVIDLRRCEGGDDGLGRVLLAHLLQAPYTPPTARRESAYERVPYELARFLETWDYGFFDRTGQVTRGPGRNWRLPDAAVARIEPVARPWRGRAVALVGPVNSSAAFLLARDLQRSGAAHLLGRRTGGNLRGLNGGQICWCTLPGSGLSVDIPLLAHLVEGDDGREPPDRGVEPDTRIEPTWAQLVAGDDAEMAAARAWLART